MNEISVSEKEELTKLEGVISEGLSSFMRVAQALLAIRDKRLYRGEFSTFEEYCKRRWRFTRSRASQLIEASEITRNLSTIVDTETRILPSKESVVRPLAGMDPTDQRIAWDSAVRMSGNKEPTASVVKAAARSVHFSSETDEWNTPKEIINLVLNCFDEIDLDPCSNNLESPNIPAKQVFTRDLDGLSQRWHGRVYMNPPYGKEIGHWVGRLVDAYKLREIEQAIALLPARTDTRWFQRLKGFYVAFIEGRLKFGGAENSAPFPSMLVYFGDDPEVVGKIGKFADVWVIYANQKS